MVIICHGTLLRRTVVPSSGIVQLRPSFGLFQGNIALRSSTLLQDHLFLYSMCCIYLCIIGEIFSQVRQEKWRTRWSQTLDGRVSRESNRGHKRGDEESAQNRGRALFFGCQESFRTFTQWSFLYF